jgi:hypothetical protein
LHAGSSCRGCRRRLLPAGLTFNCVLQLAAVLGFGGECVTEWHLPIIIRLQYKTQP